MGRLVAGVAHELNNPISFVLGNVHVLQRYCTRLNTYLDAVHRPELPADLQALRAELRIDRLVQDLPSLMEGTLEGAQRTTDIVSSLKRFSTAAHEKVGEVELNAVVERAIHWVKMGTAPGFEIHWTRGPDCHVIGNAGQLLQVMMNLLQNAYDAASADGERTPQLVIAMEPVGARVRLHFSDNGPGITAENLSRIFDPFFTTKSVGKGTGLGLSISYGIVEQHAGELTVENLPQGGGPVHSQLADAPLMAGDARVIAKNPAGVTIGTPFQGPSVSKSSSLDTITLASHTKASAKNLLSLKSRHCGRNAASSSAVTSKNWALWRSRAASSMRVERGM